MRIKLTPNGLSVNDYENQINVLKTELKEIQENINRMVRIRSEILQSAHGLISSGNSNSGNISESRLLGGGKKKRKRKTKTKTKTKKTKKTRKNKTRRQRGRKV